jgi:excisionase family DNA binding protein
MDDTTQLLTVTEVADWLRVEPRYVYRLASSGAFIRVYIGRYVRIQASSVTAYITAHTVEAAKPAPRRRPGPRARHHLRAVHDAEQ